MSSTERSRLFCIISTQKYLSDVGFNKGVIDRSRKELLAPGGEVPPVKERGGELGLLAAATLVSLKRVEQDCGVKLPVTKESVEKAERQSQTGIVLDFVNAEVSLLHGDRILEQELSDKLRLLIEQNA